MSTYLTPGNGRSDLQPAWTIPNTNSRLAVQPDTPFIYSLLWRNKYAIVMTLAACLLAAIAISKLQTPLFRAQALVEVQGVNGNFMKLSEYERTGEGRSREAFLGAQIRLLKSEALARKVTERTRLNEEPIFFQESPARQWLKHVFRLDRTSTRPSVAETARRLLRSVNVGLEGDSDLISIEVEAPDANLAATLSNTLASEYIDDQLRERSSASIQTSSWLTNQLEDFRTRLQESERALQDYSNKAGLLITGENSIATDEQLRQVQADLSKAQADRAEKEAELHLVASVPPDTLPKVLDDGPLREYNIRLTDLRRQLANLNMTLTPEHYKVGRLKAEIAVLELAVERERSNVVNRIQNEYAASVQRENLVRRSYENQAGIVRSDSSKAVRYHVLKREVDTNRELYGSMLQKAKEAGMLAALQASSMRLVDLAQPPIAPFRPNLLKNIGLGILGGVLGSILLVLVRERLDRTLKRRGEMVELLEVPELGVIPSGRKAEVVDRMLSKQTHHTSLGLNGGANGGASRGLIGPSGVRPRQSLFTEAFHCTATSILLSHGQGCEVLLITSPHPRAGKSTVVANLGTALARSGRRGVLVDGDLRRPALHSTFNVQRSPGLAEMLRADVPVATMLEEGVRDSSVPGLKLITVGDATPADWVLLQSSRMAELLDQLRKDYDFVLIDSPPMLHLTDARIMGQLADAVVLVCRAGYTRADQAVEAARLLSADGTKLMGTILNDWNVKAEDPDYLIAYSQYGFR